MIKASELRIGNWIMTKGIPYKATAQTILALEAIPSSSPNAIPLLRFDR
jgi:hypothetical protein